MAEKGRAAAFLDIDGTLVSCMTQGVFITLLRKRCPVRKRQLAYAGIWYFLYHRGIVQNSAAVRKSLYSILRPFPKTEIDAVLRDAAEVIRGNVRPEMRSVVEEHRRRGDFIAAITGSIRELVEPLCRDLGIGHLYSMRLHAENDRYTSEWEGTLYEGEEKSRLVKRLAQEHGLDLDVSAAYADSMADLPMLETVGTPVVVHPDPRLLKQACKRGWRVLSSR